uniref:Uncharacterized protein n=1 Tax=Anguilla anguilla TaxID=7936 RepID=A0A0E9Q309_ANGAN
MEKSLIARLVKSLQCFATEESHRQEDRGLNT